MTRSDPDLAAVAALLADPSRAVMLDALLDGSRLSAGDLARRARVSPQTASSHLARLLDGGLVAVEPQGRRREFRLAGPEVASALEALSLLARPLPTHLAPDASRIRAIRDARTCYDHLAGALGVAVAGALCSRGWLDGDASGFRITSAGEEWFPRQGIDLTALRAGRRPLTRACLDWSEREPHLAGALGAALATRWFDAGWLVRVRACRAVRLTDRGRRAIRADLGIVF